MPQPESFRIPPSDAHVVVEGGHHTIRPSYLSMNVLKGPAVFYLEILATTPPLPYEVVRKTVEGEKERQWVIFDVPSGAEVRLPDLPSRWIMAIQPPTPSELHSLQSAVNAAREMHGKVAQVAVALLIGDLHLPTPLRHDLSWALPREYKTMLQTLADIPFLLLRESVCQNFGEAQVIKKARRAVAHPVELATMYESRGFTLLRERPKESSTIYLTADVLLDEKISGYPVLALTKGGNKPACGTTLAGKMLDLVRKGYTHLVAWYDVSDDVEIRMKNIDGAIITACFAKRGDLHVQVVTMEQGQTLHVDVLDTASLRRPGARANYEELATDAKREARHLSLYLIAERASGACCIYPHDDIPIEPS